MSEICLRLSRLRFKVVDRKIDKPDNYLTTCVRNSFKAKRFLLD